MSDELSIELESLTVGEIEEIEEITGYPIDKVFDGDRPRGKVLRAIGFVVKRRENPDFTLEDAGRLVVRLAEPDPTTAVA